MKNLLYLIRPHHYIKNVFILLPLFFSGELINVSQIFNGLIAFVAFSISASAIYIFNDYMDIKNDRKHPKKKYRPLANGSINKNTGLFLMIVFLITGVFVMYFVSINSLIVLIIYIILNLLYSLKLKQISLLDICIISIGFVLRLYVGSFAYNVELEFWIIVMTFLLALFLALAKRRDDVLILNNTKTKMRKSIDGYNLKLIDESMSIMSSVIIVAYIQYTTSFKIIEKFNNENLYLTSLFVIFGIMRYLQITLVKKKSGSPTEVVLKDKIIQINLIFWILSFAWIIYN
jgi:decaprenyl-phosphate phosphoribosyltransferase